MAVFHLFRLYIDLIFVRILFSMSSSWSKTPIVSRSREQFVAFMFDGLYKKQYKFLNLFVKMAWMHYLGYFKTEEIE